MFTKTKAVENNFINYLAKLDEIIILLAKKKTDTEDLSVPISKIRENFSKKTSDFYREDRKLRIAVIGQVKAGKSTFLNTMLFDGKDVLPKAATPKTANLTVIKYGENNFLEIDFYSESEWDELTRLSQLQTDVEKDEIKVAKEITEMVKKRNLDFHKYIGKTDYKIEFNSYEELLGKLNDFAGENGEITPLVKSLQMTIKNENIKTIEIVDTPGMNDPIVSRTDKTRQFVEYCDVVFFLSRCPKFLDKSDMELLTRQLPQKGVSKLYLVGSQYDSSINDSIWDKGSFEKADSDNKKRLYERANLEFNNLIQKMKDRGTEQAIIDVISNCKNPILISSMAHNMSKKGRAYFNEEEMVIFNGISEYKELTNEMLTSLGNFAKVDEIFMDVIANKDATLVKKAENFIPASVTEVTNELDLAKTKIEKRINLLAQNDIEKLKESKKQTVSKKHKIHGDVENCFGNLLINLDKNRVELYGELRKTIQNYSAVTERTGTEEKTGYNEVSTSKWYNPFSWGSTKLVAYNYTSTYTYLDVSDAIENIRYYANTVISSIEEKLNEAINFSKSKKELLNAIINNFDTSDINFDPSYFRLLVEKTLNSIDAPLLNIDIKKDINELASKFTGEIREGAQKSALRIALNDSLHSIFSAIEKELNMCFSSMKTDLQKLKDNLAEQLLKDITDELDKIESLFKNREHEIKINDALLKDIQQCIILLTSN